MNMIASQRHSFSKVGLQLIFLTSGVLTSRRRAKVTSLFVCSVGRLFALNFSIYAYLALCDLLFT